MKKSKFIGVIGLTSLAVATIPMVTLASCANQNSTYTQQALDEFLGNESLGIKGITSCPRPGRYYDAIVPYLKQRAMSIAQLPENEIHIDEAHNIYFDIPATKGYENKDMIILQGHIDMIVAGLTDEETKTTPIDAVIEDGKIHSRNFKTSLGADNGIGLSIALTILKNRDKIVHPPLRFLMTADEDIGMVGASKLDPSWLTYKNQPIKWLMNIDAEEEGYIYDSCAGNSRAGISKVMSRPDEEEPLSNEYTLTIDGLLGGHSAMDIIKNRANADRLAYEFLFYMIKKTSNEALFQLSSQNHEKIVDGETKDINYSQNQIIANCKLVFRSNLSLSQLQSNWEECLNMWQNGEAYNKDNWAAIRAQSKIVKNEAPGSSYYTSIEDATNLIKLMGDYTQKPKEQENLTSLYYGVLDYNDEAKTNPKSSINLGPVTLIVNDFTTATITIGTSTRSSIGNKESHEKYTINWLADQYKTITDNFGLEWSPQSKYYPWAKDENNQLVKLFAEGYRKVGVTPTIFDDLGGVEPAWWTDKSNGNLTCACIGPRIDGAHSINETLFVNTIEPCINNLINAINTIANK